MPISHWAGAAETKLFSFVASGGVNWIGDSLLEFRFLLYLAVCSWASQLNDSSAAVSNGRKSSRQFSTYVTYSMASYTTPVQTPYKPQTLPTINPQAHNRYGSQGMLVFVGYIRLVGLLPVCNLSVNWTNQIVVEKPPAYYRLSKKQQPVQSSIECVTSLGNQLFTAPTSIVLWHRRTRGLNRAF